jgi:hypothetical protein
MPIDAALILPPETFFGKCEIVAWAEHTLRTLFALAIVREEAKWTLAIRFGSATQSRRQ